MRGPARGGAGGRVHAQREGPDGWRYEAERGALFFAGRSVPGLGSRVEVKYFEEGTR